MTPVFVDPRALPTEAQLAAVHEALDVACERAGTYVQPNLYHVHNGYEFPYSFTDEAWLHFVRRGSQ